MNRTLLAFSPLVLLFMGQQCCPTTYYQDLDGDGYGNSEVWLQACDPPAGYVPEGGDCDDTDSLVNPGMQEVCNAGVDDDCNPLTLEDEDGDGDGFSACDGDCNDRDPTQAPGRTEICDGKDNDCNGVVDDGFEAGTWYRDQDGDGFGTEPGIRLVCHQTPGYVVVRGDCDDQDALVHPGADDPADDGVDQDCGGTDGPEPHVGLSEKSFSTIQAALDAAKHDTVVWVGPGEYFEHDITFRGKVVRLAATHPAEQTIVNALEAGRGFVFVSHETPGSILDGFTITGGWAEDSGGGIHVADANPTLLGCHLVSNRAGVNGGGLYMHNAFEARADGCTLEGNLAPEGAGAMVVSSDVTWTNFRIERNEASERGGGVSVFGGRIAIQDAVVSGNVAGTEGGGLYVGGADLTLTHTVFVGNNGGGRGGGLMGSLMTLTMSNVTLDANEGERGGNIYFYQSGGAITHTQIVRGDALDGGGIFFDGGSEAGMLVENTLFTANEAASRGGAVYLQWAAPRFRNVIIVGNVAHASGGGFFTGYGLATFERTILAYNNVGNGGVYDPTADVPTFYDSDIYNPAGWINLPFQVDQSNLTAEPEFLEYAWSDLLETSIPTDFHLALTSPNVDYVSGTVDPDGSAGDVGIFGGEDADRFDLDGDGFPAYYWPGTYYDAPPGIDPNDFDCEDGLPDYQTCL